VTAAGVARPGSAPRARDDVFERGAALERHPSVQVLIDERSGFTVCDDQPAVLGEQWSEARVRFALVTAAQQQHVGPFHRDDGDRRGGDVRRFGVVDPQDPAVFPDGFQAMGQRTERAQSSGNARGRHTGCVHR
jgi:hypothetical protein